MSTYDYNTTYETAEMIGNTAGVMVGGFFLIFGIIILVALACWIIGIIGQWKAFKKAGKGGWEAIIPIYNTIVMCQISGVSTWWVLIYFLGSIVLNIIPVIGSIASMAVSIYFLVLLNVSVARSYGKSDGYAAGLIFLAPVFWLLIGGKNTQYLGPKPMKDVVMDFINKGNSGSQPQYNQPQQPYAQPQQPMNGVPVNGPVTEKFCTSCGYKVTNGERFCPGCGKEII